MASLWIQVKAFTCWYTFSPHLPGIKLAIYVLWSASIFYLGRQLVFLDYNFCLGNNIWLHKECNMETVHDCGDCRFESNVSINWDRMQYIPAICCVSNIEQCSWMSATCKKQHDTIGGQQLKWMQIGSSSWRGYNLAAAVGADRVEEQQLKWAKLLVYIHYEYQFHMPPSWFLVSDRDHFIGSAATSWLCPLQLLLPNMHRQYKVYVVSTCTKVVRHYFCAHTHTTRKRS